jgi:hypothetical protein
MDLRGCGRHHGAREQPRRAQRDLPVRTDGDEAVEPAVPLDVWTAGGRHVPKGAPLPGDLDPEALAHLLSEGWAVPMEEESEEV